MATCLSETCEDYYIVVIFDLIAMNPSVPYQTLSWEELFATYPELPETATPKSRSGTRSLTRKLLAYYFLWYDFSHLKSRRQRYSELAC